MSYLEKIDNTLATYMPIVKNDYFVAIVAILLALFAVFGATNLPMFMARAIDNSIIKFLLFIQLYCINECLLYFFKKKTLKMYVITLKFVENLNPRYYNIIALGIPTPEDRADWWNRYKKEIKGTTVTVQNTQITVDTTRENRNNLIQRYILMGDNETLQWKFNDTWLTLSKSEVGTLVTGGATYVQSQFDWEKDKIQEIENKLSLTTDKNRALIIFNLSQKFNCTPIEFINKIVNKKYGL